MSGWYENLIVESQRLAFRFYKDEPLNKAERFLFEALRQFLSWLSEMLAEFSGKFPEKESAHEHRG